MLDFWFKGRKSKRRTELTEQFHSKLQRSLKGEGLRGRVAERTVGLKEADGGKRRFEDRLQCNDFLQSENSEERNEAGRGSGKKHRLVDCFQARIRRWKLLHRKPEGKPASGAE